MLYDKEKEFIEFTLVCAMMVGAMGMNIVPKDYFGIVERFSVFAVTGYNAVLGIELYRMKF